ncbi:MAG TPA: type II secretion system F family protein [Gallionella sp.]|nr:type II secretion system F family protein [Gallionella sp.]
MALYSYRALDERGRSHRGLLDAASELDLELHLKRDGLDLIDAKPDNGIRGWRRRRVRRTELIMFFLNLEQLTRAGVPLLESLADLRDTMNEPHFREIIASLIESIEGGKGLSQAMSQHPDAFDKIIVSLTHTGEESGRLQEVFRHITESLKWQDEIASYSRTILIYPAIVGIVVLALIFFLMIYLVPQLVGFIKSMGQELPLQTRMLLAVSAFFVNYWHALLSLPLIALLAAKLAMTYRPELRYAVDKLKLELWLIGPILRKIVLARFANVFALMYGAGISVLDGIANSREVVNNLAVAASLEDVMQEIEAGKNLTQSFRDTGMFPPLVIRMLKVGETTGALDQALLNVSYFYDREAKDAIRRIQVMVEPVLTLVLGALLGWVMLSVLAPIYDILGKVRF